MGNANKAEERLGQRFISKDELGGYEFVIVEYNDTNNVLVEFQDKHKAMVHTSYHYCKNGSVRNPYHPSVCGVGYLGTGDFKTKIDGKITREYGLWKGMISRCYGSDYGTYANVTVCDRWLAYANLDI